MSVIFFYHYNGPIRGVVNAVPDRDIQSMFWSAALSAVLLPIVRIPAAWYLEPWRIWWSRLCRWSPSSLRLPSVRMPVAVSPVSGPTGLLTPERHSNTWRRQERDDLWQHSDTPWASQARWDSSIIKSSTRTFCWAKGISSYRGKKVICELKRLQKVSKFCNCFNIDYHRELTNSA